jgi:perosamine synthetase
MVSARSRESGIAPNAGQDKTQPIVAAQDRRVIPIAGPSITDKEVALIAEAAREGWHENYLKYIKLFEAQFAEHAGRKYSLATSSGTGALHLAYLALGIEPGDEIIVPNITWIASIDPALHMGAVPVFADIEADTWCIDPADVEHRVTERTKAILVVHLYGHMAEMDPILEIAARHQIAVLEDAAQAVGATYGGRRACSFGEVSAVSFTGTKTMVTGEGGMVLTDDEELHQRAALFNDHCQDPEKRFWNLDLGYKYKMSNIQAACGIAQLERLDELVARKREIFGWYQSRLGGVAGLQLNCERSGTTNAYWMTTVIVNRSFGMEKEQLMESLGQHGIQTRPFFYPLSELPPLKAEADTPVALDLSPRGINLPSAHDLSEDDVDYVCSRLLQILGL